MKNHRKTLNPSAGFLLIELAVVVSIVSLLVAGALGVMKVYVAGKTVRETQERIITIKGAMAAFKQKNGRLPCPAALSAAPGSENFGVESSATCATSAPTAGTTQVTNTAIPGPNNTVRIGAVPFVTLGISAQDSVDGWNDRFLYAVSEHLANEGTAWDDNNGAISIIDNNMPPNISGPNPNHTPFVLISMGPSGHGAYTYHGVPRGGAPCASTGPQRENCDMIDAVFRSMPYSSVKDNASRFDNILSADLGNKDSSRICGDQGMIYGPGHPLADVNGCIPYLKEADDGKVGIGTLTPTQALDVRAGTLQVMSDPTHGIQLVPVSNTLAQVNVTPGVDLSLASNGADRLVIKSATGNIGVGTAAPATRLDVAGYIKVGTSDAADCTAALEGSIRYNARVSPKSIEVCNGIAWSAVTIMAQTSCGTHASGSTWAQNCPSPQTGTQTMSCTNGVISPVSNCVMPLYQCPNIGPCGGMGGDCLGQVTTNTTSCVSYIVDIDGQPACQFNPQYLACPRIN